MTENITENLVKATNVIGLKVLSKSNGLQFTTVKDIMYDPRTQRVAYLITDEGGWFSEAKVIPFSSIAVIGPDRVMVPNEHVEVKVSMVDYDLNTLIQNDDIIKNLNIVTEAGEKLGKVVNFIFDAESGVVREFEVSQGLVDDITNGTKNLRVKEIKVVGVDAVIVTIEASTQFQEQAENQGIKGAVNNVTDTVAAAADATKDQVVNIAQDTKNAALDAKDKVVEVANNTIEAAKPKIEDLKQSLIEKKDDLVESSQPYLDKAKEKAEEIKQNVVENTHQAIYNAQSGADKLKNSINENTPDSKDEWVEIAKQKATEAKETLENGGHKVVNFAKEKSEDVKNIYEQSQIDKAIGYTLNRDIIHMKTNAVIAQKGSTIDRDVIKKAKEYGVLNLVIDPNSYS